jgi:hypothetical protein
MTVENKQFAGQESTPIAKTCLGGFPAGFGAGILWAGRKNAREKEKGRIPIRPFHTRALENRVR